MSDLEYVRKCIWNTIYGLYSDNLIDDDLDSILWNGSGYVERYNNYRLKTRLKTFIVEEFRETITELKYKDK